MGQAPATSKSGPELFAEVLRLKAVLEDKRIDREQQLATLEELAALGPISSKFIRDTGIGKTVNTLGRSADDEVVRQNAQVIVEDWREAHRLRKSERHASSAAAKAVVAAGPQSPLVVPAAPTHLPMTSPETADTVVAARLPPKPSPRPGGGGESEDEYAGCFDGAEEIVSAMPPPVTTANHAVPGEGLDEFGPEDMGPLVQANGRRAPGSPGSPLGSDLDDSEFEEPKADNFLYADFARISRGSRRWTVQFRHGVLRVHGVECLFSAAAGVFDVDAGPMQHQASLQEFD